MSTKKRNSQFSNCHRTYLITSILTHLYLGLLDQYVLPCPQSQHQESRYLIVCPVLSTLPAETQCPVFNE